MFKMFSLLSLFMALGTIVYPQDLAKVPPNSPNGLAEWVTAPIYTPPGNIIMDIKKVKKGSITPLFVDMSKLKGTLKSTDNIARKDDLRFTGCKLANLSRIRNGKVNPQGFFVADYEAGAVGTIEETIEIYSTQGTYFVYLQGQVTE